MSSSVSTQEIDDEMLENTEPRLYECCVLFPYPMPQKEEAQLIKEVEGLFAEAGATLKTKDVWGRRGLAYPIKDATEASITVYYYEILPEKLAELDKNLRITKGVLRHMFVKPPKGYQILKYGELYDTWIKERESVTDKRAREREERLREQVAAKAKRRATRKPDAKPAAGEKISGEALNKKLDKFIEGDALDTL